MIKKASMESQKTVLTLMEAAHYCRLSYRLFKAEVDAGKIPHRKAGRKFRFLRSALDAYLLGQ